MLSSAYLTTNKMWFLKIYNFKKKTNWFGEKLQSTSSRCSCSPLRSALPNERKKPSPSWWSLQDYPIRCKPLTCFHPPTTKKPPCAQISSRRRTNTADRHCCAIISPQSSPGIRRWRCDLHTTFLFLSINFFVCLDKLVWHLLASCVFWVEGRHFIHHFSFL